MTAPAVREKFATRHDTITVNVEHQYPSSQVPRTFCISYSPLPSGRIGEVWVNSVDGAERKVHDDLRDACILLSMALQYGATLEQLAKSMLRDARGRPHGVIGAILDALRKEPVL